MFQSRSFSCISQKNVIASYNLLVDALDELKIKTSLKKLDPRGACNGLVYGFAFYEHQGRHVEYVFGLMKLASIKTKDQFIDLLGRAQGIKFFELHTRGDAHLVSINKVIAMLEGIGFCQKNQTLREIGALWDKTYTFICRQDELAASLNNVRWQSGDKVFVHIRGHIFYIKKSEEGFYLFEPNRMNKHALFPEIMCVEKLAEEIMINLTPFVDNLSVALSMQFISYASQGKNTFLDHAILDTGDLLEHHPQIKNLCDDYLQRKLSRLDCALAIHKIASAEQNISDKLSWFLDEVFHYIESEQDFIDQCLSCDNVDITAYISHSTLLYLAAFKNQIVLVENLLTKTNVNINDCVRDGATAFYIACEMGHTFIVETMLKHAGVKVNQTYKNGTTPLFIACQKGHVSVVELLLNHPWVNANQAREDGMTALYIACQQGHVSVVELLRKHSAYVNWGMKKNGVTPLYIACRMGHAPCVRSLLSDINIHVNQAAKDGSSPLYIACASGYTAIVELLLQHPVIYVNQATDQGDTPLYIACQNGHASIVELLIANGAMIDAFIYANTEILLEQAKKQGNHEIFCELLKSQHAGFIPARLSGFTALHAAIFFGHVEIVKSLIAANADVHAATGGLTCRELAKIAGNREIESLIEGRFIAGTKVW